MDYGAAIVSTTVLFIAIALVATVACIFFMVWLCKLAYNHGKQTGNTTVSIILIVVGCFFALPLIPGIFHLIGTTNASKNTSGVNNEGADCIKIRCHNCKQLADEKAAYCHGCGTKLN
ncbi:MAG: hypothetical protein FWF18_03515 [Dehalococcoidia bacterium]|nr:hypothetical protein [Dehalococcoidia bacterium]